MLGTTALDALREETKRRSIITLCRRLDSALGNGIATSVITEFCGAPGSGKTQFCFQLCVNVQIPKSIGGAGGRAIFIDTNQDFSPYRLEEIAQGCSKRYEEVFKNAPSSSNSEIQFSTENILSRISYDYCRNHNELLAAVEEIKNMLKSQNDEDPIKLIVIDSICHPFRILTDYPERTRMLQQFLTDLQIMADENDLAVVITNDLTTKLDGDEKWHLCPSLGESHGHKIRQRIMLSRMPESDDVFVAYLAKTILSPPEYIKFKITDGGIRGAD